MLLYNTLRDAQEDISQLPIPETNTHADLS
jgi:hypothetical protein